MSRKAMQMALEALESDPLSHAGLVSRKQAIAALRQALETEQEPVGWLDAEMSQAYTVDELADASGTGFLPLYTAPPKRDLTCVCGAVWEGETMVHPPRKREWVGLTHPQIHELDWPDGVSFEDILLFVRAIEQALKEKNHGS